MAAEEKDIVSMIEALMKLKKELRSEQGKKRRKPEEADNTDILKQKRNILLSQLEDIVERNEGEFKKALEELTENSLSNFYVFLDEVKKDHNFRIALPTFAKQALNSRRSKAADIKPKAPCEKKPAKVKKAVIKPEDIVSEFLHNNRILEVTLGQEKIVIDPKNAPSISLAVNAIIQYFGFHHMKTARSTNLLLNLLDPECHKKDEELITLLLSAGKKQNGLQHLSFPYLICFEQPGKKGQFALKANFDEAMSYRFYHIIFHAILYFITVDINISIDSSTISVLREMLSSLDKILTLEYGSEKRKSIKKIIFDSSQDEFSPSFVYNCALQGEEIGKFLKEEGMRLEAKETLIEVKALAKHVIAFMNSKEEDAIIILGVPEEKKDHGDGELVPNCATGFSYEECVDKVTELKEYITGNIGIINSGRKFIFDQAVFAVIVPLKNISKERNVANLENKYCLLLRVESQDYLSYLRLDAASGSHSQAIVVYVRDYCKSTIESGPAGDRKILQYFLYKEFLAKERHSAEIKVLYKANRVFGYFGNSFKECANDQEKKKVISIYYLAKIYKKMLDDCPEGDYFMLYDNLLRLLEAFCQRDPHPADKLNKLIKELHSIIVSTTAPTEQILTELKQALRETAYIPPKIMASIAEDDPDIRNKPSGNDSIAMGF